MPNLGAPEIIVLALVVVVLFGWKKLPDMARSLGRSARVFKSEVNEMKQDGTSGQAGTASGTTVQGDVVTPAQPTAQPTAAQPTPDPTRDQGAPRNDGPAA